DLARTIPQPCTRRFPKFALMYTPQTPKVPYGGSMTARIAALAVLLAATPTALAAQVRTGSIGGTVTNDEGNRLPGVAVTLENDLSGLRRSATTDAEGYYEIPDLPVEGDYVVRVSLAGFATVANEKVAILTGGRTVVNFVLRL